MTQPIQKYESNAVVIEARLVGAASIDSIAEWCGGKLFSTGDGHPAGIEISTLEGKMKALLGDWVICGTEGEFYPCKDSVFQRKYHEYNETLKHIELEFDTDAPTWATVARVTDWLRVQLTENPHISIDDIGSILGNHAAILKDQLTSDELDTPGEVDEVAFEQPTQQIIHVHNGGTVVINNPEVL